MQDLASEEREAKREAALAKLEKNSDLLKLGALSFVPVFVVAIVALVTGKNWVGDRSNTWLIVVLGLGVFSSIGFFWVFPRLLRSGHLEGRPTRYTWLALGLIWGASTVLMGAFGYLLGGWVWAAIFAFGMDVFALALVPVILVRGRRARAR